MDDKSKSIFSLVQKNKQNRLDNPGMVQIKKYICHFKIAYIDFSLMMIEITATSRIHVKSGALHISQPCKPVSIFLSGHFPVGKRQHQL